MRIAVFGTGGVGGYFGARLAASGEDVGFIARGAHLAAMRERGLQIKSPLGDIDLKPVKASDDPADIGPVDVVLFCVKLYDTESAAARLKPLLGPDTAVISLQNGVDSEDQIAKVVGKRHVVGGVAYISAGIEAPGVVRHLNNMAKLAYGELDGRASSRLVAFRDACKKAGFACELSETIETLIWEKFVLLASMAGVTGVTRSSIGPILADADTKALFVDAVREVAAVAKARGLRLPADVADRTMKFVAQLPPTMKASLAHDLDRGNRIEIEGLSGTVVRLGREAGVPTPAHSAIYAALKLHAAGKPAA
ncbi:MAG TPA: 2-dehydropantoate 2-reductase [Candidatus Cybelea sp.]|nr:2-dehydropantoate 2-reductase [Candidatus Cybelea sp.]